jgi:hypothetical protein
MFVSLCSLLCFLLYLPENCFDSADPDLSGHVRVAHLTCATPRLCDYEVYVVFEESRNQSKLQRGRERQGDRETETETERETATEREREKDLGSCDKALGPLAPFGPLAPSPLAMRP